MLGVHEATGSKPVFLTISEKLRFSAPFEPNVVGYPTTNENGKTPADARKRGVLGNQFIGNIPTTTPCSKSPGPPWR